MLDPAQNPWAKYTWNVALVNIAASVVIGHYPRRKAVDLAHPRVREQIILFSCCREVREVQSHSRRRIRATASTLLPHGDTGNVRPLPTQAAVLATVADRVYTNPWAGLMVRTCACEVGRVRC